METERPGFQKNRAGCIPPADPEKIIKKEFGETVDGRKGLGRLHSKKSQVSTALRVAGIKKLRDGLWEKKKAPQGPTRKGHTAGRRK